MRLHFSPPEHNCPQVLIQHTVLFCFVFESLKRLLLKVRELHYKFGTNLFFSSLSTGVRGKRQEVVEGGQFSYHQ